MTKSRVERFLRLTGAWEDASTDLEQRDAIFTLAEQDGVKVSDEELQEAVDAVLGQLGLLTPADTQTWLARTGLDLDDIEREVEAGLLEDRLRNGLDQRAVEEEFQRQRIRFDAARLKVFVTDDLEWARSLVERLTDNPDAVDGSTVERLIDRRVEWGFYLREELPEQAAAHVFRAMPGDVIGPVQVGHDRYAVYCVEELRPAVLDRDVEGRLRTEMVAARADRLLNPDEPRHFVLK